MLKKTRGEVYTFFLLSTFFDVILAQQVQLGQTIHCMRVFTTHFTSQLPVDHFKQLFRRPAQPVFGRPFSSFHGPI